MPDEEVTELYTAHPLYQMSDTGLSLEQLMDIFSLPEMMLLSSVIDHVLTRSTEFNQVHLYKDVSAAHSHMKGVIHKWTGKYLERYILHRDEICAVLNQLVNHKKKIFPITVGRKMAYYLPISTRIPCFAHLFALVSLQAAFSFALFNCISTKACSIEFPACPFSVHTICR